MKESTEIQWRSATSKKVTSLTFDIDGLKEGESYEFRVTAENKVGQGPPSNPSTPAKYGKFSANSYM
jgi:titin